MNEFEANSDLIFQVDPSRGIIATDPSNGRQIPVTPEMFADLLRFCEQRLDSSSIGEEALSELARLGFIRSAKQARTHALDPINQLMLRYNSDNLRGNSREPVPAFKEMPEGSQLIKLQRAPVSHSISFANVMERRRSVREYSARPLTFEEISSFFFQSAVVKKVFQDPDIGQTSLRPTPSGGARHPLETYLLSLKIENIPEGLYHYDPREHSLCYLRRDLSFVDPILNWIFRMTATTQTPQAILFITAMFGRTTWKYGKAGYSIILKDLGALSQTFYLVATALNLAPCAIGSTMGHELSKWMEIDSHEEDIVGCFLLGAA